MTISLSGRVENTVGKGKDVGFQHFLFSHEFWIIWQGAKNSPYKKRRNKFQKEENIFQKKKKKGRKSPKVNQRIKKI